MSLEIRSGIIRIVDDTVDPPEVVFDSDERLFTCTDLVSGNITLPARSATWSSDTVTNINVSTNYALDTVNSEADIVLGGFSVTTFGGGQGINALGVFNAGGTYVHYQDGYRAPVTNTLVNVVLTNMAAYTFYASGGVLYLNERVQLYAGATLSDVTLTLTLLSVRFDYKLFAGTLI